MDSAADRLRAVTRRRLGRQVLAEDRFSRALAVTPQAPADRPLGPEPTALTSLDPSDYGRLRGLVSHAFIPPAVVALRAHRGRPPVTCSRANGLRALADRAHGITPCSPGESAASREELRSYVAGLVADAHYEADTSCGSADPITYRTRECTGVA
ncbi:hypothetical protein [Streptomyces sp. NPDC059455]|uniref:hypothetical protein n=1 Tax=Streptomyces sp. NPDC059455 TaxID=3346837 RepID=UPI0036B189C8